MSASAVERIHVRHRRNRDRLACSYSASPPLQAVDSDRQSQRSSRTEYGTKTRGEWEVRGEAGQYGKGEHRKGEEHAPHAESLNQPWIIGARANRNPLCDLVLR